MSGAHLGRHDFRGAGLAYEFWPNPPPVIGAQVPAADGGRCGPLNVNAALNWHRPVTVLPLRHGRLLDAYRVGQCLLTTKYGDRLRDGLFVICAHARIIGITYRMSSPPRAGFFAPWCFYLRKIIGIAC